MSCGCGKKGNCGCGSSGFSDDGLPSQSFDAQMYPGYKASATKGCVSNKGKFYDLTTEDFTVPQVGKEAYVKVCDGTLWKANQYIGIALTGNTIAAFKVTGIGQGQLKILNGCDKSGDNPIAGNPEPGVVIAAKSVMYPIPPTGCESGLAQRILQVLQTSGVETIIELLSEAEDICFTSVPDASEDEEVHLFGGTRPDCECAEGLFSSCLRKIKKVFTGQGGRTICAPEAAVITLQSEGEIQKRIAVFDENGCIKKGPTYSDLKSCDNADPHAKDVPFDAVSGCNEGIAIGLTPSEEHMTLTTILVDDPESENPADKLTKWVSTEKKYAVLQHKVGSGISGGATLAGVWTKKVVNTIVQQSTGLITLNDSEFIINKPGLYKIDWSDCFYRCRNTQTRLENVNDSAEVYYSLSGYQSTDQTDFSTLQGSAYVKVEQGATKRLKIMYRAETAIADGLGEPNGWGPNVYSNITISAL